MKFNFKKVASVIASAVMITSTIGFAAASNYPAPFNSGSTVVVYGSGASLDAAAAVSIQQDLNSKMAPTTTTTTTTVTPVTATGGDSVAIQGPNNWLNVGDNLTSVKTTQISSTDMPNLLAGGTYRAHGNEYAYTQKLVLANNLQFNQFASSSFNNDIPTLGVKVPSSNQIMNYTLSFSSAAQSSIDSNGHLATFENTPITILGKQYTITRAINGTHIELDLMGGAASDTVNTGEEKTLTVGNQSYTVKLTYVDSSSAKMTVNGEDTGTMDVGDTYTLQDGTVIGLTDTSFQDFAGGIMSADVTLGQGKLVLIDGQTVQLNQNSITGLMASINAAYNGANTQINYITLSWSSNNDQFLAPGNDLVFPGLQSVKLTMANITQPNQETTQIVNDGNYAVQLQTTVKDGPVNIDLVTGNGTVINGIGRYGAATQSGANILRTSDMGPANAKNITFDSLTDQYFVATFASGTIGESYVLRATTTQNNNANATDIQEWKGSNGFQEINCGEVTVGNQCTIGNVVLTVAAANYPGYNTTLIGGSNVVFNQLITAKGLDIYLPVNSQSVGLGYINLSANPSTYNLTTIEQDKNSNIGLFGTGEGNLTVNIASIPLSSTDRLQPAEVYGLYPTAESGVLTQASQLPSTSSSSNVKTGYEAGDLATQVTFDQTTTPNVVTLTYHGGETYGNVFVAATGATISPGTTGTGGSSTVPLIKDTDIAQYSNDNLIVVGGSCVNSVAAKLLGSDSPLCGADFTAKTQVGAGHYIIETFTSPYSSDKVAMLVAGYEAAETQLAAQKVLAGVATTLNTPDVEPTIGTTA